HPARLAEVDRLEVPAVDDRGYVAAGGHQVVAPGLLCRVVWGAPCDVVDGADRLLSNRPLGRLDDVDDRVRATRTRLKTRPIGLLGGHQETHHRGGVVRSSG